MSRAWAGGSTRRWRAVREVVLLENALNNGGACRIAYPGEWTTRNGQTRRCTGRADCVHHPRGKAAGDTPDNLMAACTPCNLRAGDPAKAADPPGRAVTRWE